MNLIGGRDIALCSELADGLLGELQKAGAVNVDLLVDNFLDPYFLASSDNAAPLL